MFPRSNDFPRSRARALAYLFLTLAFVFAAARGAEAAGVFISAPNRVDMVYDSGRDTLYITSGGSVLRYRLGANSFLTPFNLGGSLSGLDLSPDGNTLVVADKTRTETNIWVHVINLNTGASSRALFPREFGEGGTFTVAYGGDGRVLVTSTYEGSGFVPLRKLDPATGAWSKLNNLFTDGGSIDQDTMLAASGDRSVIGFAESNSSDGRWGSYNVPNNTIVHRTWYENGTSWFNYEIGVNKNGTQYAIPTYGGTFIYNSSYAKIATLGVYAGAQPIGVVYHPVEDIAYFPWTTTTEVRAFNTNTFAQIGSYNFEDAFKHNGSWAFVQGRMKMSRDGSVLFATVTNGVRFIRLYAPLAAADQSVTTAEDTPVAVTLSGSVGNGGALSYRVVTQPAHGTLSGAGADLVYTPEPNYAGPDSFTFKSLYGPAESAPATVSVTVTGGDKTPTADDQSVSVDEDGSLSVTLTGADPDGSPVTFSVATQPAYGTLSGTAPNLVYTPMPNYYGSDSFAFGVSDGASSNTGHVYITVNGVNDAPSVTDQGLATDEDTPAPIKLRATDIDSSPLSLSFTVVSPPSNGTLSGTAPDLVYTPNPNYNGADNIGFKVNDGEADSNVSSVLIYVNSVNDAPKDRPQQLTASEDTPLPLVLYGSDADGDPLTYNIVRAPAHGSLSGTAPNLVYTPAPNYYGGDYFIYSVSDGAASSISATVSFGVTAVNDAPVAPSQSLLTYEDTGMFFRPIASDPDGDVLTYQVVTPPQHGTLSGTFPNLTYTPELNYNGADSFTFKASDGVLESNVGVISIEIRPSNDPPVANAQTVNADEDASAPVTLTATDIEGDPLGFGIVNYPQHGALSGAIPNLSYKAAANYNGPDSFTYRAYDGKSWSETVTVTINVAAVNDAPAASPQTVAASEDASASIVLSGSDLDGDAVGFADITAPAHGTLSGAAPNLVYTPAPNYYGPDSFTFRTSDGSSLSAPATVTINVAAVNDAPTATGMSLPANEDTARAVYLTGYDPDNNPLTYSVVTQPAHGTLSGAAPNLVYTPAPNYYGPDSFTFKVNDGAVDSPAAAVQLNVAAVNDAPAPNPQTVNATEDTTVNVTLTAADVDGDQLSYFLVNGPQHGGFVGGVIPNLVYRGHPDYSGPDSFTFYVSDGKSQSAPVTVTVNVAAVNDAPVAAGDTASVVKNTAISLSVLANDSDVDGDSLIVATVTQPPNGTVSIAAGGKSVTYTPKRNFVGTDTFSYAVSDGRGGTASASVTITVRSK